MDNLTQAIIDYAKNPENPVFSFNLAVKYLAIDQTAAAVSFFLRTAERTLDDNLAYECLLNIGLCFEKQGNRNNSVRGAFLHALCLLPTRPEVYYLLAKHYQGRNDHPFGYSFAEQGLKLADFNQVPLKTFVGYRGKWSLIFQKMVSAWWWGKAKECRDLLQLLKTEYRDQLDQVHWNAVQNNLSRLGAGPYSQIFHTYNKSQWPQLRYQFPGSENIERNWSQVFQDMFVLSVLNGKTDGVYLEIGAADPESGNNTKLLEEFGWTGIGIEIQEELCNKYRANRKNPVIQANALEVDYNKICKDIARDGMIDYLQLDCEPSATTYMIMTMLPFDKYKFGVITYEHDDYVDLTQKYRTLSRQFLESKGYILMVNDVSGDGISNFEDWWVHPEVATKEIRYLMKDTGPYTKHAAKYIFNQ